MNSFNFFTTSATTSSSNVEKRPTSKKLYSNDSEDLLKKGKNKKSRGRRGLTLTRIVLCHNKNFRDASKKGKK
jgi:hypothetical protein